MCETAIQCLLFMIKFCDGFVADISFFIQYLCFCECLPIFRPKKSEIKTEFLNKNELFLCLNQLSSNVVGNLQKCHMKLAENIHV